MSRETMGSRRSVLKALGTVSASTLIGSSTTAAKRNGLTPDFDPYDFEEVNKFVNNAVRHDFPKRPMFTGEFTAIADSLSDVQLEAIQDAIRPSVFEVTTSGPTASGIATTSTDQEFIGQNIVDKWGWDIEDQLGRSESPDEVTAQRNIMSATIHAYAVSIDWTAYEWRAEIQWDTTSSGVTNTNHGSTVLHTNHGVDYEGTEVDIYNQTSAYDVEFQATFDNTLGQICDPSGSICIQLGEVFYPVIRLLGDSDGEGEVVYKDNDALT